MGILDGLSLLILFSAGNYLQGILQALLLQGKIKKDKLEKKTRK